ncbi:MAG: hypothetical protein ACP5MD_13545, partial [Verrucomicrobiia bacterium]
MGFTLPRPGQSSQLQICGLRETSPVRRSKTHKASFRGISGPKVGLRLAAGVTSPDARQIARCQSSGKVYFPMQNCEKIASSRSSV